MSAPTVGARREGAWRGFGRAVPPAGLLLVAIAAAFVACKTTRGVRHALRPLSAAPRFLLDDFEHYPAGTAPTPPWQHRRFDRVRAADYRVVRTDAGAFLHGEVAAGASVITLPVDADPHEFRRLRFRWRTLEMPERADVRRREGDDSALRVFVTFAYEPGQASLGERLVRAMTAPDLPGSALCYVCADGIKAGSILPNAFTHHTQMVILPRNGAEWTESECDLVDDYTRAFGRRPPRITGVGFMVDADQTGGKAASDIDALELGRTGEDDGIGTRPLHSPR